MLVIWVVALAVPAPTSTKHSGTNWITKSCSKAVKLFVIAPSHIITERRLCAATVNGKAYYPNLPSWRSTWPPRMTNFIPQEMQYHIVWPNYGHNSQNYAIDLQSGCIIFDWRPFHRYVGVDSCTCEEYDFMVGKLTRVQLFLFYLSSWENRKDSHQ